jgi:hypothetical protein
MHLPWLIDQVIEAAWLAKTANFPHYVEKRVSGDE